MSENGVIVGSDQMVDTNIDTLDSFQRPHPLTTLRLPTDRHVHALLAVFWADVKTKCDDSAVCVTHCYVNSNSISYLI